MAKVGTCFIAISMVRTYDEHDDGGDDHNGANDRGAVAGFDNFHDEGYVEQDEEDANDSD